MASCRGTSPRPASVPRQRQHRAQIPKTVPSAAIDRPDADARSTLRGYSRGSGRGIRVSNLEQFIAKVLLKLRTLLFDEKTSRVKAW